MKNNHYVTVIFCAAIAALLLSASVQAETVTIPAKVPRLKQTLRVPKLLPRRCRFVLLRVAEDNHCSFDNSTVTITGAQSGAQGVTVSPGRRVRRLGGLTMIPLKICIEKQADKGQWTVQCDTDVTEDGQTYVERIEATITVSEVFDRSGDNETTDARGSVYGRVFDASDDAPLSGVKITASGASSSAQTDADGRFVIDMPAAGSFGIMAEKDGFTYAQRKAVLETKDDVVAVSDMYLTPVDPADITIGPAGGTGSNSDGSIQLDVPAGAVSKSTDMQATWYDRGKDLPNALPDLSHFTYACDLTPDGQRFSKPVTVRLKNERGFAPGTPIPVGVYDPETIQWEHETMGVVSDDGKWVVFEVEHFSPRDCNLGRMAPTGSGEPGDAEDTTGEARTERNNQSCGSVRAGSRVDVQDGHLLVEHILPSYRSMGQNRMLALQYNSPTAATGLTLQVSYDISRTSVLTPERIRFVAEIGGNRIERFYEPVEGPMVFAYQWDGLDPTGARLAEGTYNYRLTIANEYQTTFATVSQFGAPADADTGVEADEYMSLESSFTGSVFLDRADEDEEQLWLGSGWGLVGMYELTENENTIIIAGGDGSRYMFTDSGAGIYSPARGDSSTLSALAGGGYQWIHKDGAAVAFNEAGQQTQVQDRNGNTTAYTYDGSGRLRSITDPAGKVTSLTVNAAGTLTSITDPAGRVTTFTIDRAGDLVAIVNPDDSARYFTYDDSHRMISQTDAGGGVTAYTYSSRDAVLRVDRADGSHTGHTADYYGQPAYTDPSGSTWLFGVNSFGTRTAITDPLGRTVTMQRDTEDRITGLIMPSGKATYYTYDDNDNLAEISWSGSSTYPSSVAMTWNQELSALEKLEDDIAGTWTCSYDDSGNMLTARTADGRSYTCTYNAAGRRTSLNVDGFTETYTFNDDGNLSAITGPAGGTWTFTYDDYGNLAGVTDPDGRGWTAQYTVMNMLSTFTNGAGDSIYFTWSPARGSIDLDFKGPAAVVTAVTDGRGNTTSYSYDELYRLTGITDALGNKTQYTYDSGGRITSIARPTGDTVSFSYNRAGQLTGKALSSGETVTYAYDNETGLPTSLATSVCRLDYTYNRYDMLSTATSTFPDAGFSAAVSYEYRQGNYAETRLRLSSGENWMDFGYEWGRNGWLPTDRNGGGFFWLDLTYGDSGRLSGWYESYTGTSASFAYDDAGRMTGTDYAAYSGGGSGSLGWQYSPGGYCTGLTDNQGTHSFGYDQAGRLISATHPGDGAAAESYTYDAAGNRFTSGQESLYTYDKADRLTGDPSFTYTYNAAGNVTSKTDRTSGETTAYTYDAESRLTGVTLPDGSSVSYAYDALGRRCRRIDGSVTTNYVYDRHNVLGEFSGSGSLVRSYVAGPAVDALTGIKQGGFSGYSNYYTFTDPVGSVLVLTDEYGDPVEQYTYSAFGELLSGQEAPATTRLFSGADYDSATGLYYMRRRFYDPAAGRFLQRDPLPLQCAIAPYIYAENNPVNRRDPFGLDPDSSSSSGSTGGYELAGDAFWDRAAKPALEHAVATGIGDLPNRTSGVVPPVVDLIMPDVGAIGSRVWSQYRTWSTVIDVFGSDNPAQAGIDWYEDQWWNPASQYLDDFLTLGGMYEQRDARIHPICGLRQGLGLFFGL